MNKLFVCESPFQIIVALYLKEQCSSAADKVDILVTETFSKSLDVANRISQTNIFNNVYTYDSRYTKNNRLLKYVIKFFDIMFPRRLIKKIFKDVNYECDEIYYWSSDYLTLSIRSAYFLRSKPIKSYVFEEGYISYFPYDDIKLNGFDVKLIEFRNRIKKISNVSRSNIDGLFLFEPDLLIYTPDCPVYTIKRNKKIEELVRQNVARIFETAKKADKYNKKYIIFEENRPDIDDLSLYNEFIDTVGAENVIIKLHPVRNENRFSNYNVSVIESDGMPWEAIAYSKDFSDNILISIGSGSVTSHRLLFGENTKAFLLFKLVDSKNIKQFDPKYHEFWDKFESKLTDEKGIFIPKTREEFYDKIRRI